MTRRKRTKKRRLDQRLRPHLLRDEWHLFIPDPQKRAKLEEGLERGLSVDEAALEAGYSARHAARLAEWPEGWGL